MPLRRLSTDRDLHSVGYVISKSHIAILHLRETQSRYGWGETEAGEQVRPFNQRQPQNAARRELAFRIAVYGEDVTVRPAVPLLCERETRGASNSTGGGEFGRRKFFSGKPSHPSDFSCPFPHPTPCHTLHSDIMSI